MSLDLELAPKQCHTCGHQPQGFEANYTYNLGPMWRKIYPDDKGMVSIEGMTGEEACKKLKYAYEYMLANQQELEKLNPKNGWGSYQGFRLFIHKCMIQSKKNPDWVWRAYR